APSRTPPQAGGAPPSAAPVEHYGPPIAATPAPAAARGNAVPNIKDLAPDVRSQLPRLAVAGSVYSETPSARMVILNGQVFHEGEKPAPDTVLEQIRLKSAILNFRGQRYEITF
ncbi:MAG: general secretion pathway protein GspB, partial [Vitreoscilla sp.]